jgi:dephospho-CoA kinase
MNNDKPRVKSRGRVPKPDLVLVGVTGGIGSGKSLVCKLFSELGRTVICADKIARDLTDNHPKVNAEIKQAFGDKVYSESGILDRKRLAAIVFKDQDSRQTLNKIVHPRVFEEIDRRLTLLTPNQRYPYVLIEAALIFETGMDEYLDHTIAVTTTEADAFKRVVERDGCSVQDVRDRMRAQLSPKKKEALSDFVIQNDGTVKDLSVRVKFIDSILAMMKQKAKISHQI